VTDTNARSDSAAIAAGRCLAAWRSSGSSMKKRARTLVSSAFMVYATAHER
jgi:hypothetical protein